MFTAKTIINRYISFFEKKGHKRISNSPLVPENDPTTLFTSSGMQALVPYLLGEPHPQGRRLVNVQNCFRAQDIDEVGDNRHTTFFRMLGNWSLGDYFKEEQLPWVFEFLTQELGLPAEKLYISVFEGYNGIPLDTESEEVWREIFKSVGLDPKERIFYYRADKNWWSRAGEPADMPEGEPGGPDSEVFYQFNIEHGPAYGKNCHPNCQCGRFLEIGNSVFMEYQKKSDNTFERLPKRNVDFGGGLERILAALEDQSDIFQTRLFSPITQTIEEITNKDYKEYYTNIRIIADHMVSACFIISAGIVPSNKEQGYVLRRLIRRGLDSFYQLDGKDINLVIESIVSQYKETDPKLLSKFEKIKLTILEEEQMYNMTRETAKRAIDRELARLGMRVGDEIMGQVKIPVDIAFKSLATYGLGPTQLKSLGYIFDEQELAKKVKEHQAISRRSAKKRFEIKK